MASQALMTDPAPPSALADAEGEYALLCTLLRDRRALEACADRLKQDDFSDPFMGRMFAVMVHEVSLNREANPITLRPILEKDPSFAHFGGWAALVQMGQDTLSLLYDWQNIAANLARLGRRRAMVSGLLSAIEAANDIETSEDLMLDRADAAIVGAAAQEDAALIASAGQLAKSYVDTMNDPLPPGILCRRVEAMDQALGAIRKKDLVIGAGRPGMGKTAAALSYGIGAARNGAGTLMFSLEMGAEQLIERIISDLTHEVGEGVPYSAIRDRELNAAQQRIVCRAAEHLDTLPIHICDVSGMTVVKMERLVRRYKRRMAAKGQTLDLVIVDYLQLMSSAKGRENRTSEVTEISNGLKRIAKSEDVAVFALSQLSREVEKRPDKRPVLSDLRDSGSIEQDADTVLFFFRLEYYLRQSEPLDHDGDAHRAWRGDLERCAGRIDFICAKRRAGEANITRSGQFHAACQAVR